MKARAVLAALALMLVSAPLVAPDPPANSGPFVVRGEFTDPNNWWGAADFNRGYFAAYGVNVVSWCEGTPTDYNVWYFQNTNIPADEGLIHVLQKADDVYASVWPVSVLDFEVWPDDFCANIFEEGAPLAVGTVDTIITDNDLYAWLYDHHRANAYGISVHGVVTSTVDGERMRLNSGFRCVWNTGNGNDEDPGAHCKEKVILN